jgi:serine/threonine protein kinase
MGQVFAAVNNHIGQEVAIKILCGASAQPSNHARLLQEGRALAKLAHPGIVRILACDQTPEGAIYLVMERLTGVSLRQWLRDNPGPRPWRQVAALGSQIAAAMTAAHQRGIYHRDLTPANIMLTPDLGHPAGLRTTVLDFGLAKLGPVLDGGEHTQIQTGEGYFMGTPGYAPPEQITDAAGIDDRADVYALGVTLYECMAGRPLFTGASVYGVGRQATSSSPLKAIAPEIPAAMLALMDAMLAGDPARRPSMAQVHDALLAMLRRPSLRRHVTQACLALVLFAALGVGATWRTRARYVASQPASSSPQSQSEALLQQVLFDAQRWLEEEDWGLAQVPNTLELRRRSLERYTSTLTSLSPQERKRPAVLLWAIETRHRMGDLALYHGQLALAYEDYLEAREQIDVALAASADSGFLLQKALNHSKLGKVAMARGQTEEAMRRFDASVSLLQRRFGIRPEDLEPRRVLSVSLQEKAEMAAQEGQKQTAIHVLREAAALLADSKDDYDGWIRADAAARLALAIGPGREAEAVLLRTLAEHRLRVLRAPDNLMWRATEARLLDGLSTLRASAGQLAAASADLRAALALGRSVQDADPTDKRYALLRCELLAHAAALALRQRRSGPAWQAREECRAIADAFSLRDPQDVRFQRVMSSFPLR